MMDRKRSPCSDVMVSLPEEQLSKFLPLLLSEKLSSKSCVTPATNRVVITFGPAATISTDISHYSINTVFSTSVNVKCVALLHRIQNNKLRIHNFLEQK
jgi:hypothetical protein